MCARCLGGVGVLCVLKEETGANLDEGWNEILYWSGE